MEKCFICGSTKGLKKVVNVKIIRNKREYWIGDGYVCKNCEE